MHILIQSPEGSWGAGGSPPTYTADPNPDRTHSPGASANLQCPAADSEASGRLLKRRDHTIEEETTEHWIQHFTCSSQLRMVTILVHNLAKEENKAQKGELFSQG